MKYLLIYDDIFTDVDFWLPKALMFVLGTTFFAIVFVWAFFQKS